ncbi:unnamed protein product [Amoebophrya sp. A25]|nr:unnamed protein product [Amoebophrya sp. A25]|eukprot:GSA25T00010343001.1
MNYQKGGPVPSPGPVVCIRKERESCHRSSSSSSTTSAGSNFNSSPSTRNSSNTSAESYETRSASFSSDTDKDTSCACGEAIQRGSEEDNGERLKCCPEEGPEPDDADHYAKNSPADPEPDDADHYAKNSTSEQNDDDLSYTKDSTCEKEEKYHSTTTEEAQYDYYNYTEEDYVRSPFSYYATEYKDDYLGYHGYPCCDYVPIWLQPLTDADLLSWKNFMNPVRSSGGAASSAASTTATGGNLDEEYYLPLPGGCSKVVGFVEIGTSTYNTVSHACFPMPDGKFSDCSLENRENYSWRFPWVKALSESSSIEESSCSSSSSKEEESASRTTTTASSTSVSPPPALASGESDTEEALTEQVEPKIKRRAVLVEENMESSSLRSCSLVRKSTTRSSEDEATSRRTCSITEEEDGDLCSSEHQHHDVNNIEEAEEEEWWNYGNYNNLEEECCGIAVDVIPWVLNELPENRNLQKLNMAVIGPSCDADIECWHELPLEIRQQRRRQQAVACRGTKLVGSPMAVSGLTDEARKQENGTTNTDAASSTATVYYVDQETINDLKRSYLQGGLCTFHERESCWTCYHTGQLASACASVNQRPAYFYGLLQERGMASYERSKRVPCCTFSELLQHCGSGSMQLLHLDCEGQDFAILRGVLEYVYRHGPTVRPSQIVFEASSGKKYVQECEQLLRLFYRIGYKLEYDPFSFPEDYEDEAEGVRNVSLILFEKEEEFLASLLETRALFG